MGTQGGYGQGVVCEQLLYGILEKNIVRVRIDYEVSWVLENTYVLKLD